MKNTGAQAQSLEFDKKSNVKVELKGKRMEPKRGTAKA